MADPKRRRPENVAGPFFVDATCIDCDTCRWMAPETFHDHGDMSAVHTQPVGEAAERRALAALLACPTGSIGSEAPQPLLTEVRDSFPIPIDGPVSHCGFHAASSFGAASYFLERPDGNVLIDSPRFVPALARRIEARGGIRWLFLTHRDDVADHGAWAERFGCERILHRDDVSSGTRDVELQPEGLDPMQLAPDLRIVPVPGHTKGHAVLLAADRHLFTGDHLAWSPGRKRLIAFPDACWYSWSEQTASMQRMLDLGLRFEWVLPGHGRRHQADAATMRHRLEECVAWMRTAGR